MSSDKKILIVGPAWVGDMVMAQTLFKLLKANNPSSCLDVLAPAWTHPLLSLMPEVNQAILSPFKHGQIGLKQRFLLGRSLKKEKYDQAIILRNSYKSALVPYFAGIPRRTSWVGEMRYGVVNDARQLDKQKYRLMIERFMMLGLPQGDELPEPLLPRLEVSEQQVANTLNELNIVKSEQPVLALCPGAEFGSAKCWPADYYAELAKHYLAAGWGVWLLGSAKDKKITDEINHRVAERCVNLASRTSLAQAIDVLAAAQVIVANDSGLLHIAAALDKPLLALYGPTTHKFTPPLSDKARVMTANVECSPCFKRECPLHHHNCMRQLLPKHVMNTIDSLVS